MGTAAPGPHTEVPTLRCPCGSLPTPNPGRTTGQARPMQTQVVRPQSSKPDPPFGLLSAQALSPHSGTHFLDTKGAVPSTGTEARSWPDPCSFPGTPRSPPPPHTHTLGAPRHSRPCAYALGAIQEVSRGGEGGANRQPGSETCDPALVTPARGDSPHASKRVRGSLTPVYGLGPSLALHSPL